MKSALRWCSLFTLAAAVTAPVRAGDSWYLEFEEGRAAAKAQGKDLLIDFGGSDWCLPCKLAQGARPLEGRVHQAGGWHVRARRHRSASNRPDSDLDRSETAVRGNATEVLDFVVPDGRACGGRRPAIPCERRTATHSDPESYWNYLAPLRERGARLRAALSRAEALKGEKRAAELANALSEVDPRFISRFYADRVAELRTADPADSTGYLAFLDGRRALDEFQAPLDLHTAAIDPAAVDSLIARAKLRGETLQEALVLRAAGEVLAGDDRKAVASFKDLVSAQTSRSRFDRGDYVPLDAASLAVVRRRIAEAEADRGDGVALYYSLHRMFQFDLPNPYEWSCGGAFQPNVRVREIIGDRFGRALIRSTESLSGETHLLKNPGKRAGRNILRGAVDDPGDCFGDHPGAGWGKAAAKLLMPGEFYPRWID